METLFVDGTIFCPMSSMSKKVDFSLYFLIIHNNYFRSEGRSSASGASPGAGGGNRRRFREADRLFSRSSVTSAAVCTRIISQQFKLSKL